MVICEQQYVDRIRASGAKLEHIICIDGAPDGCLSLDELYAAGADDFDFESTWRSVQPDDVVTLIYTSGTTGNPKGVEMTHGHLLFEAQALDAVLGVQFGDRVTSFLPSAHIADRTMALYNQEVFGAQVTVVSDARAIAAALSDVRPTTWGAVPRVWEKLKAAIEFAVTHEPDEAKRQALQWAMSVAAKRAAAMVAGEPQTAEAAAEWDKADELVLSKLREKLGLDQLRWAVSGAAPIPRETLAFFAGIGIPIAEVWGMSELSCVASVSHPGRGAAGHGRQAAARAGGQDRRGRRISGARTAGDEGLSRRAGEDRRRRSTPTAGCTPATFCRWTPTVICASWTARRN